MGNRLGTTWDEIHEDSYSPQLGDFVIQGDDLSELAEFDLKHIARVNRTHTAELCGEEFKVSDAVDAYQDALESVYPTKSKDSGNAGNIICCAKQPLIAPKGIAKPRVVVPVVDGTLTDKEIGAFHRPIGWCSGIVLVHLLDDIARLALINDGLVESLTFINFPVVCLHYHAIAAIGINGSREDTSLVEWFVILIVC